jgi:hypothetical protein
LLMFLFLHELWRFPYSMLYITLTVGAFPRACSVCHLAALSSTPGAGLQVVKASILQDNCYGLQTLW